MSEDNPEHESDADVDEEPVTTPDATGDADAQTDGGSGAGQSESEPSQQPGGGPTADGQTPGGQGQSGAPSGQNRDGPTVNMGMMYGGVEVTGASDDELADVTEAATELMSNLAEEFKGIQSAMDGEDADSREDPHRHCQ